jgi:gamma-glutamyl-gamma-aminobutyrate hydrolase PuuD
MRVGVTYRFEEKAGPYIEALLHAGLEPVRLPAPGPYSLESLDGLLISGGTDLNPALYGQDPHEENEAPDDERDRMEIELIRAALEADLPVLCICRGMQLFNVARGGDLIQHLESAPRHRQRGVLDAHDVTLLQGTRLAGITGESRFPVNSRHHQAVGRLGKGLVVSARSDEGVIEGIELPEKHFAVAVQWHPEDRVPERKPDTLLFEAFARSLSHAPQRLL